MESDQTRGMILLARCAVEIPPHRQGVPPGGFPAPTIGNAVHITAATQT